MEPFGQMEVEFTFRPRNPPILKGFKSQIPEPPSSRRLQLVAHIESAESKQSLTLPVQAIGMCQIA